MMSSAGSESRFRYEQFYVQGEIDEKQVNRSRHQDTNDNASDFLFVDTAASNTGAGQRPGAPAPENTNSPVQNNAVIKASFVDPQCGGFGTAASACARVRSAAGANPTNAAFGTLAMRRKFANTTAEPISRLRFRVVNVTTTPEAGVADLRVLGATGAFDANLVGGGTATIVRLTLEGPPTQTPGGGFNSSLSAGTINLNAPLAPNDSINVEFLTGVQQEGNFRLFVNVEALFEPAPAVTNPNVKFRQGRKSAKAVKTRQGLSR